MRISTILITISLAATAISAMPTNQDDFQILIARARQGEIDTSDMFKNQQGKTFPKQNLYQQGTMDSGTSWGQTTHKDSQAPPVYSPNELQIGGSAPQKGGQKPPSYGTAEHEGIIDRM